jgi:hypothetical protein
MVQNSGQIMTQVSAVSVSAIGNGIYHVEVRAGGVCTSHTVEVPGGMATELGWDEDN